MKIAVRELLVENGITTAAQIETMDARTSANRAKVVAPAWCEPDFHANLIESAGVRRAIEGLISGR